MAFDGSCHCGAVTFTVDADAPETALSCNCSHCRRKGFLLAFLPADVFTLTSGEDALTDYHFNQHAILERHQVGDPVAMVDHRLAPHFGRVRGQHRRDQAVVEQVDHRSEEHTSELQSLMRISYAVFCLKKKKQPH